MKFAVGEASFQMLWPQAPAIIVLDKNLWPFSGSDADKEGKNT